MADPFNDRISNSTVVWQSEPATRGTFDILSTCLITLTLCVWSSIHLNLPRNERGRQQTFWHRFRWLIYGLLAPEFLVLMAWTQRQAARAIHEEVPATYKLNERTKQDDSENQNSSRVHPWTMTHSFWATMGGISIDHNGPDSFIPGFQNPTLTPKGISFLVKHSPELLPDISEEELKDRSKANSFTKIVACIQASWFCLSCIARWSQKLPVSLLELNVFTHALCAVLTYLLWWSKPFDVRQPFALRDDRLRPLLAYMWMSSETSHRQEQSQGDHTFKCGGGPEFEAIIDDMASTELNHSQAPRTESPSEPIYTFETIYKDVTLPFGGRGTVSEIPTVRVTDSQSLPGARFRANSESTRWRTEETWDHHSESPSCNTHIRPKMFFLTSKDVRRWKLAREAMDQFHLQKPNGNLDLVTYDPIEEVMDLGEGFRMIWGLTALSVVGTLYGGLHALAWDSHFPNHRELILWRASTLIIACPAVTGTILFLATVVVSGIYILFLSSLSFVNPTWKKARNSTQETPVMAQVEAQKSPAQVETIAHVLGTFLIQLAVGAFLILYLASRGYLVVESFRTAFFLPPEAYQATRWTRYFPHIS